MHWTGGTGGIGNPAPRFAAERGGGPGSPRVARPLVPGIPSRVVDPSGVVKHHELGPLRPRPEAAEGEGGSAGRLVVGPGIHLKGDIKACDRLVVHGTVEASLPGRAMEVGEKGLFTGSAEVEEATVAGRFDGRLTVRGQLTIAAGGQVTGTVRYRRLAVEAGGRISGDIQTLEAAADALPAAEGAEPAAEKAETTGQTAPESLRRVARKAKETADTPA